MSLRLARAILAIGSMFISARLFGVSQERDFYIIAISATTVIPQLIFGSIGEIFRTKFIHMRESIGLEHAILTARNLTWLVAMVSIVVIIFGIAFPHILVNTFSEGLNQIARNQLASLIQATLPIITFNLIASCWIYILNCLSIYYIPEVYGLFSGVIGIVVVILLAPSMGIHSLILSNYISSIGLFIILFFVIKNKYPLILNIYPLNLRIIKPYLTAASPFAFGYILGQALSIFEKRLSSNFGIGSISSLDYAQKMISVPQGVIMSTISSVLVPILAMHYSNKSIANFNKELANFYRFIFIIFSPLFFLLTFGANDLVNLIFSSKLSPIETSQLRITLIILSIGLAGVINFSIFGQSLVAQSKGHIFALISMINQALVILVDLTFSHRWGIWGLAATWSLAHLFSGTILFFLTKANRTALFMQFLKIAVLYGVVFILSSFIMSFFSITYPLFKVISSFVCFCILLVIGLFILRFEERKKISVLIWR